MNLYGFAAGDPVNFSDPFGLIPCPDACVIEGGIGIGALAIGVAAAGAALVAGETLGDALSAGYDAGRDFVGGIVAAVSTKILERQAKGQMRPVQDHFNKLANPNQPGANDPRNRNKWKDDIRRALDRLREKVKKMDGKQKEKWEETIRKTQEQLRDVR